MKASIKKSKQEELVAVITESGSLVMSSSTPWNIDKGYPCHMIRESVSLTRGGLDYWLKERNSTPVYKGDTVTLEF